MTLKTRDQTTGADALRERVDYWLSRSHTADDLQSYFRAGDSGENSYTGRWFDQLDGGGDRPPHHDHVTAADLVAVEMLRVRVPPETSAQLLHGRVGRQITDLLRQIPTAISLWQPEATQLITTGEAADRAWHLLTSQPGVGWVTAGKMLARKRPHLIPVFDEVVACALGAPSGLRVPRRPRPNWSTGSAPRPMCPKSSAISECSTSSSGWDTRRHTDAAPAQTTRKSTRP